MLHDPVTVFNFRTELDETALERGWYYFQCGWVKPPRELMPGFFEAMVEEVNPHAVTYSRDENERISDVFCTCNERTTDICRHMAAVLFWIEQTDYPDYDPEAVYK
jgi:uncharacterized Zn finger protein